MYTSEKIMSQGKSKMWVGIGSYLLSGVASTVIATQVNSAKAESANLSAPPMFMQLLAAEAGGEGGEGSEAAYRKDFTNKVSAPVLLNALRKGGHIIYMPSLGCRV